MVNLTNDQGAIQARYQYDAWGIKRNEAGTSYNRFAFTGYEDDKETGLLYAKARHYDPDTGKFLSEDVWAGDNLIAPSLHRYLYGYQNPTVWVDRTGNAPTSLDFRLDLRVERLKRGEITEEQYKDENIAEGVAAAAGLIAVATGVEAAVIITAVRQYGFRGAMYHVGANRAALELTTEAVSTATGATIAPRLSSFGKTASAGKSSDMSVSTKVSNDNAVTLTTESVSDVAPQLLCPTLPTESLCLRGYCPRQMGGVEVNYF